MITEEEKELLMRWNEPISSQSATCIHTAILANCSKSPHKPAVNAWDGDFTYGEMDELSARLAQHLGRLDPCPGSIICLCFEKSKWAIVAVLGVIRAGAAYVFVDPASPAARTKSVCEDVQADLMICSNACLSTASQLVPRTIALEALMDDPVVSRHSRPKNVSVTLTDPVYAVFTSGSTGRPKGVLIEHGGFFQRAMANGPALSLSNNSRVLQFASFVFDVANRDILYTLLYGGCICIPSESQRSNELAAFINQQRVNWASITPSASRILHPDEVPTLRTMALCGEPMNDSLVAKWADRLHLINAYGPSEATTISSMATVTRSTSPSNIGKGSGSVLWIVDPADHDRLATVGAVGELVIESPSVGRGYLNRSAETAACFLSTTAWLSKFRTEPPCSQLYKTGDLAQYAADGSILFCGRKDGQIKVNGQRVDVGEIEHWIQKSVLPQANVVIFVDLVVPKGRESTVLVAFCAPQDAQAGTLDNLREILPKLAQDLDNALSQNLPAYMIPRVYLPIQSIPTTATGKTHRQGLRQIGASYTMEALTQGSRSPVHCRNASDHGLSTSSARVLKLLWALALGIDKSSIRGQDNFLRLGGDSVMAIQVAIQARSKGLDLLAADLLDRKTLNGLADLVTARPMISKASLDHEPFSLCEKSIVCIVRKELAHVGVHNDILDILPTTATQNFFLTQWSLTGYCCMLRGLINFDRLKAACSAVVHRHSILRTVFTRLPEGGLVQVVLRTVDSTLECRRVVNEDLGEMCASTVENMITETAPAVGQPLVRFILLSKSDRQHALLVRISHAQYDGNTSPILFRDISTVYNNYQEHSGSGVDILPAATPFQRYLYTRNNSQTFPEDGHAMKFWRQNLQGASMTSLTTALGVNMDKSESHIRIITAPVIGTLPIVFDNITVPTLLNASCSLLLADLVGQNDVVFGNVMDTRGAVAYPGIETTLGPCLNINPLRVRLEERDSTTFADLCHSIGEQYAQVARHSAAWDLPDIVKYCTDWPADTQIGCIINHLRPDEGSPPLELDGVTCVSFTKSVQIHLPRQLLFRCITGRDKLEVQVLTSTALMDRTTATRLAERLVAAVRVLSEAPYNLLRDVCI
jgi:amino acid adenylation domain-containing protein